MHLLGAFCRTSTRSHRSEAEELLLPVLLLADSEEFSGTLCFAPHLSAMEGELSDGLPVPIFHGRLEEDPKAHESRFVRPFSPPLVAVQNPLST